MANVHAGYKNFLGRKKKRKYVKAKAAPAKEAMNEKENEQGTDEDDVENDGDERSSNVSKSLESECQVEPGYSCLIEGCTYKGETVTNLRKHISRAHPIYGLSEIKRRFFS
nr:unnamed protein product [Callosobruchus analis]